MDFFAFQEKLLQDKKAAAASAPASRGDVLTVSQLTAKIERALKDNLPPAVLVKGEVSNYKHHGSSGHLYFTLKDAESCIDCVMFRSDAARLKFTPRDGIEMIATGRVAVYGQRGRYQFYATRLEPLGQGALELAFAQLVAKLEAQGLFAPDRKRPIPAYPRRIVLITSTQTAAIADILKVLRRYPFLEIQAYHVPVQGDGAAQRIAQAIADVSRHRAALGGVDLILLARGGGSLEDLWAFNEEVVARAIVASQVPIITGIGHEIDVSIADLVADHHAHTPTEAAQIVVANWRTARESVEAFAQRLRREVVDLLEFNRDRLTQVLRHEVFRRPADRVNLARQMLDDRQRALSLAVANRLRREQSRLHDVRARLEVHSPAATISRLRLSLSSTGQSLANQASLHVRRSRRQIAELLADLRERHPRHDIALALQRFQALKGRLDRSQAAAATSHGVRLEALSRRLEALNPQAVLRRGYSITMLKRGGRVVRSAADVKPGDALLTHTGDGDIASVVEDANQGKLFE